MAFGLPKRQGLYDPAFERDACGVGFVANIKGQPSHEIIEKGIEVLVNLTHRGASGSDPARCLHLLACPERRPQRRTRPYHRGRQGGDAAC